jgi:hypothetical protein
MGNCRFCGKSAGWFSDSHEACTLAAQAGVNEIKTIVSSAVADAMEGKTLDVRFAVEQVRAAKLVPVDEVRTAVMESWSTAASEAALKEPLPAERQTAVSKVYEDLGLTGQEMKRLEGFRATALSFILWAIVNDEESIYTDAMVSQNPFNLKSGEIPIAFFGSVVYSEETTTMSYEGGYRGLSVRVLPGVYSHFGGFKGQPVETNAMKEIDYGGMLLTTKSLYFGGDHTTFCIPISSVLSFRPQPDGIGLSRNSTHGKPEVFAILLPDANGGPTPATPSMGWFLFNALHFLASKYIA